MPNVAENQDSKGGLVFSKMIALYVRDTTSDGTC